MTLASVLNQAMDEVGMTRPSVNAPVAADMQTQQMVALLKRTGERLLEVFAWSGLITQGSVVTVANQESYAMPPDFDRFVDETQWYEDNRVPVFGPMNQQDWAQNQFGMINVGPYFRQQLRGDSLFLQPTPSTTGQTLGFYYVSSYWIVQQSGTPTPASTFSSDSDTFLIRDDLLVAGLKWRWLRAKRLSYDEERDEYDRMLIQAQGADRGARKLSLDPLAEQYQPRYGFVVPVTGFGS